MTIDTKALRELAMAATTGEWLVERYGTGLHEIYINISESETETVIGMPPEVSSVPSICSADAEYIAAANPATVLALLDEIDRLRKVESATLQGEKIGCRCTYADNQTVDAECLYHRAIRSERDRLRAELTDMRADLNDARSEFVHVAAGLNDAAQCIARQSQTISRLQGIEAAAQNLAKVKGRHHSELAMNQLLEVLK